MSENKFSEARAAEEFLKKNLRSLASGSKYTSKYETRSGRRLMLNREIGFIGLFMEINPVDSGLSGVALNKKNGSPGHYAPNAPRAGSVGRDERLGLLQHAYYVRCESVAALKQLVYWYDRQN